MGIGKIAVLGGGPGSLYTAGELSLRGFEVHFWGRNSWKLAPYFHYKRVRMTGMIEATAELAGAGDDLAATMKHAQLVLIPMLAAAHREMAERCAHLIEDGQVIMLCSNGHMGSVEFTRIVRDKGIRKDFICVDWPGIPVGGRFLESGEIRASKSIAVKQKGIGVFPARRTEEAVAVIAQAYPAIPVCESPLATSFLSIGGIRQAVGMLMNATVVDRLVYTDILEDGFTPAVARVRLMLDKERKAVQEAWGFKPTEGFVDSGEERADETKVKPPGLSMRVLSRMDWQHRYVVEAVPYDLVFRSSAAAKAGVDVPGMNAVITLLSTVGGEDYFRTGRTLESLGLGAMSIDQIKAFVFEGFR